MHAILKLTIYRVGPFLVKVESRLHFQRKSEFPCPCILHVPHTSKLIRCVEPTKVDKKGKKQRRREKRHRRRLWMLHCCTMWRLRRDVREIDRRTEEGRRQFLPFLPPSFVFRGRFGLSSRPRAAVVVFQFRRIRMRIRRRKGWGGDGG